jgi:predicted CXXCH cytochrome family protein
VNYNVETKTVTEWNVGCERCHGPGSAHAAKPSRANIINPARLDTESAIDLCVQCHSQGQPPKNPIAGKYYDWPVGFNPGASLKDFWNLEEHKLGETTFTHYADGTAHKNRMQGNDFSLAVMHRRGVTCWSCHDVHGTDNDADLLKPAAVMCLQCHGPKSPNGPHGSIEAHTHHPEGSAGSDCVACHMPKIETTLGDVMVRSHTFRFISPALTEKYKIPNSCNTCHTDKSSKWALDQLKKWPEVPWWRLGG